VEFKNETRANVEYAYCTRSEIIIHSNTFNYALEMVTRINSYTFAFLNGVHVIVISSARDIKCVIVYIFFSGLYERTQRD